MHVKWASLRERDWKVWDGEGASLICMGEESGSLLPSDPVEYSGPAFGSRSLSSSFLNVSWNRDSSGRSKRQDSRVTAASRLVTTSNVSRLIDLDSWVPSYTIG